MVANRTGESPPSGMTRGALGNMAMVELCTHPAIERAGLETLHLRGVRPSSIPTGLSYIKATDGTTLIEHVIDSHGLGDATQ